MKTTLRRLCLATLMTSTIMRSALACDTKPATSQVRSIGYVVLAKPSKCVKRSHQPPPVMSSMESGSSYKLSGRIYGTQVGSVTLDVGAAEIECQVQSWSNDEVAFSVPPLSLRRDVVANLIVRSASGHAVASKTVRLQGATKLPIESQILQPIGGTAGVIPGDVNVAPLSAEPPPAPDFDMGEGLETF